MKRARDSWDEITRSFARLAAAEARLAVTALSCDDAAQLARLRADIAAGLVLLLSRDEGSMGGAELAAAAQPLVLAFPENVMARLPAAGRLAGLDLAALAERVAKGLAAARPAAPPTNEKPRRRQGRPRLELVAP